jgi:NTP pyrophosphatase (non-canonical NTP hydrolase)
MDIQEYTEHVKRLSFYPNVGNNFVYPALALGGEAGEVQNVLKKVLRDQDGVLLNENRRNVVDELGDVFFYAFALAAEMGVTVEQVLQHNVDKLNKRQAEKKAKSDERS